MKTQFIFEDVSVSWTKYDIVRITDLVESEETMRSYYSGRSKMDPSILKSALALNSFSEPLPEFWSEVMSFDLRIRTFFLFFLMLFSNYRVARSFAEHCYSGEPFKGTFNLDSCQLLQGKELTNMRSLLVESGLSSSMYRRAKSVPFDGTALMNETKAGPVFREALDCYFKKNSWNYSPDEFFGICKQNSFHEILGLSEQGFESWLKGQPLIPSYVQSLSFDNFLCFNRPCCLNFEGSKEIYFVGENGDGKTMLLMAIFAACRGYQVLKNYNAKYIGALKGIIDRARDSKLQVIDNLGRSYSLNNAPPFENVFAYGVHRGRFAPETDSSTCERYGFMSLFNMDLTLRDPVDWLLKSVLDNTERPELTFTNLQITLSEILNQELEIVQDGSRIYFLEKGVEVSFTELSEGFRSTLIFVCDLLIRLSSNCPKGENVFKQQGLVLIDEICLHLHPKWQRIIVGKLREVFPNIQFIMTTHSPIVLLGAGSDAIFFRVVRDQGDTYVSDPYYRKEWDNMMLNTIITSSLFGVESASMVGSGDDVDTNDSFIRSRIDSKIRERLDEDKRQGKAFFSKAYIDDLIDNLLAGGVEYDQG